MDYFTKCDKLNDIYFQGEEQYKIGEYRQARECFMKAEIEVNILLRDSPFGQDQKILNNFRKRCQRRQEQCLEEIVG